MFILTKDRSFDHFFEGLEPQKVHAVEEEDLEGLYYFGRT
jgi:3-methyladenine DNA glycosylase Tag